MMKSFWVILMILLIYGIIITIYILKIYQRLRDFEEVLTEIEEGRSNQKFLLRRKNKIDRVGFRLNSILYKYEKEIEESSVILEANKQLLTSLSHDVRTPMTTLIGYLDALDLKLVSSDKEEAYIKLAKRKAYDLKKYIEVLFEWFRLNSDEEQMEIKPVDISEVTRKILLDWVPVLEEHRMKYSIEIPERAINVEIDESCYMRIVNNIIQNTIAHSKAGQIWITAIERYDSFTLRIDDDGIGIAKEDLKYIFERLYKCDKGRSQKGNGLGLNIAQLLAEKMNGKINAVSEPGKGAVFFVTFPIYNSKKGVN